MAKTGKEREKTTKFDHVGFRFQWSDDGLKVLQTPGRLETYRLPPILQESLRAGSGGKSPGGTGWQQTEGLLPFGTVANILHRARWGSFTVNFEPAPHNRLFIYLSLSQLRLLNGTNPIAVTIFVGDKRIHQGVFERGKFSSPSLLAGHYRFIMAQGDNTLMELFVAVEPKPSSPNCTTDEI
jgi:hypothetical protein